MAKRAKVLVIDDDQDMVAALECLLGIEDFRVLSATNADEGVRKAREERPEVILLDLLMTPRSGIEVYQELRADPTLGEAKILIVTALKEKLRADRFAPEIEACWEAEDFIDKPIEPESLVERIRELVSGRGD
jgi:DNA-binding response OmpR family regulator